MPVQGGGCGVAQAGFSRMNQAFPQQPTGRERGLPHLNAALGTPPGPQVRIASGIPVLPVLGAQPKHALSLPMWKRGATDSKDGSCPLTHASWVWLCGAFRTSPSPHLPNASASSTFAQKYVATLHTRPAAGTSTFWRSLRQS